MLIMNGIFHKEMNECIGVNIDDISIYSKSENNHVQDLGTFRKYKLLANARRVSCFYKSWSF